MMRGRATVPKPAMPAPADLLAMAQKAHVTVNAIRARIRRGVSGPALTARSLNRRKTP